MTDTKKGNSRPGDFSGPLICGVDEAGRGPLAGPVVAAAVILSDDLDTTDIKDSKRLSPASRELIRDRILKSSSYWGIGVIGPKTVDDINILQATFMAMRQAIEQMGAIPNLVLVDGSLEIPDLKIPQRAIIKGDSRELAISAASILAKTYRDEMMIRMDDRFPGYGFSRHKGYPTKYHITRLEKLGPSPIHRISFHPVCNFFSEKSIN